MSAMREGRWVVLATVLVAVLSFSTQHAVADEVPAWDLPVPAGAAEPAAAPAVDLDAETAVLSGPEDKFARGLLNTAGGLAGELVSSVFYGTLEGGDDNSLLGVGKGAMVGVFGGVVKGAIRTGVGLVELVTFPIKIDGSYDPLLDPEFPF
jgi:putative exosortase-associated protein (TIGR04073 family)